MITEVSAKKSAVMHNALWNIKSSDKIMALTTALNILAVPLLLLNAIFNIISQKQYGADDSFIVIAVIATVIGGLMAIYFAAANFRYLFDRNRVDMYMSLPLSSKRRFMSDFFSGLFSYLVPFAATQILSMIIFLFAHIFVDGNSYTFVDEYQNVQTISCTIFGEAFPIYLKMLFCGILTMIMLYTVVVLVCSCCGTLFETILFTFVIGAGVPGVIALIFSTYFSNLYGIDCMKQFLYIITTTSPVGGGVAAVVAAIQNAASAEAYGFKLWVWALIYIAVTLLIFAAAYYLCTRRRAEQTAQKYTYAPFYYTAMFIVTLAVTLILLSVLDNEIKKYFITIVFVSAAAYTLISLGARGGFKHIVKDAIAYAAMFAASLCLTLLISKTNCFGIITKVPDASSVNSVEIVYSGAFNGFNSGRFYSAEDFNIVENDNLFVSSDSNVIGAVTKAHSYIIEEYKKNDNSEQSRYYSSAYIGIRYNLKSGKTLTRFYHYSGIPMVTETLLEIDKTQEYRDYIAESASNIIREDYQYYQSEHYITPGNQAKKFPIFFFKDGITHYAMTDGDKLDSNADEEFVIAFADALESDIKNMTTEEYLSTRDNVYGELKLFFSGSILIRNCYKNTIALLEETYPEIINMKTEPENRYADGAEYILMNYEDYTENTGCTKIISRVEDYFNAEAGKNAGTAEGFKELLEKAETMYITDEKCYTIYMNGELMIIPSEYSDEAERIYNSLPERDTNEEPYA